MGRYSRPLAGVFADFAHVRTGQSAIDVGCGSGALTSELARRLGNSSVSAVDPSPTFIEAVESQFPGVETAEASAEALPFADGRFDAALAQLVVHFMPDPVAGLSEMRRVTREKGVVAACVWDFTRDETPLSVFWRAALALDPSVETEVNFPGAQPGDLGGFFASAGLSHVEETHLSVQVEHPSFEDWWEPFTFGVGPAGDYVRSLDSESMVALREQCRRLLPDGAFAITARAWSARGIV